MTDEPYRWLEAIANRREYVHTQIQNGSPVLAVSLDSGILLLGQALGPRSGPTPSQSLGPGKIFEIFDRQALGGLGHPADLERVRQSLIDAAHLESFTRSPADVSLRRLATFNLGPQLKNAFEQVYAPPFLVRLLLAELGTDPGRDLLMKVHFDGTFALPASHVAVLTADPTSPAESELESNLARRVPPTTPLDEALSAARETLAGIRPDPTAAANPTSPPLSPGHFEAAFLRRDSPRPACYTALPTPDPSPAAPRRD